MLQIEQDGLKFSFPEIHPDAVLRVDFQRTLRIPDDDRTYHLPAGLGRFPLRHVDDVAERVPERWTRHGGVLLPMWQSEALWLNFHTEYPFAIKVAAGKINAVTGEAWEDGLHRDPQDYVVAPDQPWLDGFVVEKGTIRQFVAMPLGDGYTVEAQLTGREEHGGLQVIAYPVKRRVWEEMQARRRAERRDASFFAEGVVQEALYSAAPDMGLGAGGKMKQEIYEDDHDFGDWDLRHRSRCFVHLTNSLAWRAITDEEPPTAPLTSAEYERRGVPWFDYYGGDAAALEAAGKLRGIDSVGEIGRKKGTSPLPENESIEEGDIVGLDEDGVRGEVREGDF